MRKKYLKILSLLLIWIVGISCTCFAQAIQNEKPLTLPEAIETAKEQSLSIKAAEKELSGAICDKNTAITYLLPQVQANYHITAMDQEPFQSFGGTPIVVAHKELYHWDLTVMQPLFHAGLYHGYKTAKFGVEVKQLEKEIALLDITRDTKKAFYNVLLAQKLVSVTSEAVEALTSHEKDAQKFYEQGLIPYNDLLRAQVALANAVQQNESASGNRKLAVSHFNLLLRYEMDKNVILQDIDTVESHTMAIDDLIGEALEKRPELLQMRANLKILDQAVKIARSEYYPKIALVGQYFQDGDDLYADHNDFSNRFNSLISVQAQWNLFQWGRNRFQVKKNFQQKAAVEDRLKSVEDMVSLEVENAYLKAQVAEKNIITAERALNQARENSRMTKLQFQQQVATSTDVLDARTFHSQANTNYFQALYGYMIAVAELDRAVGRNDK